MIFFDVYIYIIFKIKLKLNDELNYDGLCVTDSEFKFWNLKMDYNMGYNIIHYPDIVEFLNEIKYNNLLCLAVRNDDTKMAKLLLMHGADIHTDQDYLIRYASKYGYESLVILSLFYGANINAWDNYALREASLHGHTDIVKLLIENGASFHT